MQNRLRARPLYLKGALFSQRTARQSRVGKRPCRHLAPVGRQLGSGASGDLHPINKIRNGFFRVVSWR